MGIMLIVGAFIFSYDDITFSVVGYGWGFANLLCNVVAGMFGKSFAGAQARTNSSGTFLLPEHCLCIHTHHTECSNWRNLGVARVELVLLSNSNGQHGTRSVLDVVSLVCYYGYCNF